MAQAVAQEKILFVDDELSQLEATQRLLRGKFDLRVAPSGQEGLRLLEQEGPMAVVVSDLRMPGMDGVAFLERVRAASPDTVRIMLTGHADLEAAIRAVNEGQVFRFLTKPCQAAALERALYEGIRHYQLVQTEREYLALKRVHESLEGITLALVRLVETKDPYTAGHQTRVARLASAMAEAMDLPEEQVEQINVAATIHDIGKIYVPAEFLSKPGVLNQVERDLLRMHPQIGHDILEPINFPFPLHKIVLQHHERLDGSGYPLGLRDRDIMLEARIIAVADVVEAMCSHRPYRPAKGLALALEELRRGQGTTYDPLVVEAALGLLTGGGFALLT